MNVQIHTILDYQLPEPTDMLLQIEAAHLPEQPVSNAVLMTSPLAHFARVSGHDEIGERILVRAEGRFTADYVATVEIQRNLPDVSRLDALPPHMLPGGTVQYLFDSIYCPANQFRHFVDAEFDSLQGGARIAAMRDFIERHFSYVPGSSTSETTALESFVRREGVCRDYAHMMIALARASNIPARMASVYAIGVDPPDFHAVAEVFLDGGWHLVDATGMASAGAMAKIGIGRDAADVSFLTAFGPVEMNAQSVEIRVV
jgi:hypothetical protein